MRKDHIGEVGEVFAVWQFFRDGTHECVGRHLDAKAAVKKARDYCHSVGATVGTTVRVIITDDGDYTVFEWRRGRGVVFPPACKGKV